MRDHPACKECVLREDCLLRESDDVESCQDVREYEIEIINNTIRKDDTK